MAGSAYAFVGIAVMSPGTGVPTGLMGKITGTMHAVTFGTGVGFGMTAAAVTGTVTGIQRIKQRMRTASQRTRRIRTVASREPDDIAVQGLCGIFF
jgi:hypothetical protein